MSKTAREYEDSIAGRIARERDSALDQIVVLKVDLARATAAAKRANSVIAEFIPRLKSLPAQVQEELAGLDAVDALDLIAKRGGEFKTNLPDAPEPTAIEDQAKRDRAVNPRNYR